MGFGRSTVVLVENSSEHVRVVTLRVDGVDESCDTLFRFDVESKERASEEDWFEADWLRSKTA